MGKKVAFIMCIIIINGLHHSLYGDNIHVLTYMHDKIDKKCIELSIAFKM